MEHSKINHEKENELCKLNTETKRLQLIKEGKLEVWSNIVQPQMCNSFLLGFDVARSPNLMPKFNEDELDAFSTVVERLSNSKANAILKRFYPSSLHLAYTLIL